MIRKITATGALTAGVLSAIGASICCLAPLLLDEFGIARTWSGRLTALAPMRPFWLVATVFFFGVAFWLLYLQPEEGELTDSGRAARQRQRTVFWAVGGIVLFLLVLPWYAARF